MALGITSGAGLSLGAAAIPLPKKPSGAKYRAGVVGLGWTGLLYDVAKRDGSHRQGPHWDPAYRVEDNQRITPEVNVHRKFHHHDHPGNEGLPTSYAEALWDRPEVELVAGAERDERRLKIFGERYGIQALYTDALEMYRQEKLDIVAVCTNTKGRAFLTVKAAEAGAKAIFTEKPMAFTLEEADRMVKVCADRGIPLSCGAITTTHPSFAKAKELVTSGAIGEVTSIEARGPGAQHQNWSYFLDSPPALGQRHGRSASASWRKHRVWRPGDTCGGKRASRPFQEGESGGADQRDPGRNPLQFPSRLATVSRSDDTLWPKAIGGDALAGTPVHTPLRGGLQPGRPDEVPGRRDGGAQEFRTAGGYGS